MHKLTSAKNHDYSSNDDDGLSNFFVVAEFASISPQQTWMTLLGKHITAVQRYVSEGKLLDETIRSRLLDIANYCVLGAALFERISTQPENGQMTPTAETSWIVPLQGNPLSVVIEDIAKHGRLGCPWNPGASAQNVKYLLDFIGSTPASQLEQEVLLSILRTIRKFMTVHAEEAFDGVTISHSMSIETFIRAVKYYETN